MTLYLYQYIVILITSCNGLGYYFCRLIRGEMSLRGECL